MGRTWGSRPLPLPGVHSPCLPLHTQALAGSQAQTQRAAGTLMATSQAPTVTAFVSSVPVEA